MNTPHETEHKGERVIISVANPAAGANLNYTLLTGYNWEPVTLIFRFLASAVVMTRTLAVNCTDGASTLWRSPESVISVVASGSKRVSVYGTAPNLAGSNYGTLNAPFSPSFVLAPGSIFNIVVNPIDAGDQISECVFVFRRCLPRT